jgi:tRNA (guanine-N7-)-methyltransferase
MKNIFKNFYGRVSGHLSEKSNRLLKDVLPVYSINDDFFKHISNFKNTAYKEVTLEIGFGSGDFIFQSAKANPDVLYIGVEVFLNGVASLLGKLEEQPLSNIKIYNSNLYNILDEIPENIFDNIYILFPDPWPKKKHHKRRLINSDNLFLFSKILKPQGGLRFVSDYPDYVDYALENILSSKLFIWNANDVDDFTLPPKNHFETKYERKAKQKGSPISYLDFVVAK